MCGIVGYIGHQSAQKIILEGLKSLEYRGYDSAGMAIANNGKVQILKSEGKISRLESKLIETPLVGTLGIGHTRWATHGKPTELNAHPHPSGKIVLIQNGIIENYIELKERLISLGKEFVSETDTEAAAHLVGYYYEKYKSVLKAIVEAAKDMKGSYALGLFSEDDPEHIYCAKNGAPLIVGKTENEGFYGSDIPALVGHATDLYIMEDLEICELSRNSLQFYNISGEPITKEKSTIRWSPSMIEKGGYKHFMLKEIHEQPTSIAHTISTRVLRDESLIDLEETGLTKINVSKLEKIQIVACGTSWHAGLVGKFLIEEICRIPCEVDLASEFRYRNPIINDRMLLIPISQSGETADTLASLKHAKEKNVKSIAVCNVMQSAIPRMCDGSFYTLAGPEIGVASTKAFTTQIVTMYMMALALKQQLLGTGQVKMQAELQRLVELPAMLEKILGQEKHIEQIAYKFHEAKSFMFIGRGIQYPIALEGALKLKEISYIHAEGYPAGELKHGPIALIDHNLPTVAICLKDRSYDKTISNIEEIKSRDGRLIIIATEGDRQIERLADEVIYVPEVSWELSPIVTSIPLQLLAYFVATQKGTDVDQPRNLAKSVTVE